jgi:signal transduction histidine kinase
MFDHRGQPMGDVVLRHTQEASTGVDAIKRFRIELPTKQFEGTAGIMVPSVVPRLRAFLAHQMVYSTYAADIGFTNESTAELKPHLIRLPDALPEGMSTWTVDFEVNGHDRQEIALDQVWYGPYEELGVAYKWRYLIKWIGVHVLIVAYLLSAIAALAFWNSDRSYRSPGWFAGFCGFAALAMTTGMATESPPVDWPLYLHFAIFFVGITCLFLMQFIFEKTGVRSPSSDKALLGVALFFVLAGIVLYEDRIRFPYALVIDFSCLLLGCILVGSLAHSLFRKPEFLNWVLLGGVLVSLLFGAHSVAVGWWTGFYATSYSLQFAPLPITLTMGWVVIRRYARMKLRTDALNRRLTRRVAQRETQLQAAFVSISQLKQDEAVRQERERFMRDMHDGLGAQLIASLRMASRGSLSPAAMQEALQECLDELRFSIESLKPTANDILSVLGNFRYRLEPRLQALGIRLAWHTQDLAPGRIGAPAVLQILRILNEAITNALKHTQTTQIDITGQCDAEHYLLQVRDYGAGFDTSTPEQGEGLQSMQQRARRMGGLLTVDSNPQGTTLALRVPLEPAAALGG